VSLATFHGRGSRHVARLLVCSLFGGLFGASTQIARANTDLYAAIPALPLADALAELAHQTGLQFIYVSRIATNRTSHDARAGLTPSEALQSLLEGTGLGFQFLTRRTVRIVESTAPVAELSAAESSTTQVKYRAPWLIQPDEVLVTGSRGEHGLSAVEELRSIASSVSVVSGGSLAAQKLEQISDYTAYLPGVNATGLGNPGIVYLPLRGIPTYSGAATGAYYLDDAPVGPNGGWADACCEVLDLMPYDLVRLEVLRGPQATHYGANAELGVIRFVLAEPNISEFQAHVGADTSSIQGASEPGASLRGMVNVPIVKDVLAARLSAYDSYTPGFIDNAYSGAKDVNALRQSGQRVVVLWRPSASVAVKFTGLWNRRDADSEADISSRGVAIVLRTDDAYIVKAPGYYGDLSEYHAFLQPYTTDLDYYAASVNWNPGSLAIVSATAWSRTRNHLVADQTLFYGSSFPEWSDGAIPPGLVAWQHDTDVDKFTEELHVAGSMGRRIAWSLGGFYTHESAATRTAQYAFDNDYRPIEAFAPALSDSRVENTFDEWAAFGELTWHASEHVDLTGGLRFARDDQQFTVTDSGSVAEAGQATGQRQDPVVNWMIAASSRFAPEAMLYARVATGSQPHSVAPEGEPAQVGETVTNYEVGLKSEFLNHDALFDLTAFYIDWNDIQGLANGTSAMSQGVELTSSFAPLEGLTLGYNAAYTRSKLTTAGSGESVLPGYQLPDIPRWSMSLTANYDWALTDLWNAHTGGALRWIDKRWSFAGVTSRTANGLPSMELPAFWALDLNASIARGPLTLRAFVRNLTDTRGKLNAFVQGDAANPPASIEERILQPRSIGVGFEYAF